MGSLGVWPQPEPPAKPLRLVRGWASGLWSACTPWMPSTVLMPHRTALASLALVPDCLDKQTETGNEWFNHFAQGPRSQQRADLGFKPRAFLRPCSHTFHSPPAVTALQHS